MAMFLTILKIIGISLGIILGVLILALLVVLFLPVVYNIKGYKKDGEYKVKALLHYVIPFLNFKFEYDNENGVSYVGRFLFFKIITSEANNSKKPEKKDKDNKLEKSKAERTENVKKSEKVPETKVDDKATATLAEATETVFDKKKKKSFEEKIEAVKSGFEKKLSSVKAFWNNIKEKKGFLDEKIDFFKDEHNQNAIKKIWGSVKGLLKCINPKKKEINLEIGFEDPSTTGKVVAGYAIAYPIVGSFVFLNTDFEKQVFNGTLFLRGSFNLFTIIMIVIKLYFDKEFKALVEKF